MADLARSCAKRGLKLGVYLSPRDDSLGAGQSGRCATPESQAVYDQLCRRQLTELLTRYGPMVEIWFDGSSIVPVGDILARHAGTAMIFQGPHATIRWVGNEDGFSPYPAWNSLPNADAKTGIATSMHGDPSGDTWMPNEVDVSIRRPNWFWHTDNEKNLLTTDQLIECLVKAGILARRLNSLGSKMWGEKNKLARHVATDRGLISVPPGGGPVTIDVSPTGISRLLRVVAE